MAINLFEMLDSIKNSQQVQGMGASIKNATGVSLGERPYSTCPMGCFIAPEACEECKSYKESLKKVLEDVENLEAYYSNFVVDSDAMPGGERECWYCGAPALGVSKECEYCGSNLGNGKSLIRVQSKSEIPDPIATAINIIYERQRMAARYQKEKGSGGLLKGLLGMGGMAAMKMNAFDKPMTVQEVKETAQSYGVSVGTYLSGLDTGAYLTKAGKTNQEMMNKINQQMEKNAQLRAQQTQQQMQSLQRQNDSSMDAYKRQMEYIASKPAPQYLAGGGGPGGGGPCCGTCANYMTSGKCAAGHGRNGYVSANDGGIGCRGYVRK